MRLAERYALRKELFNSIRRLDILQELLGGRYDYGDHGKWNGWDFY